jgi:hypothetical protein
MGAGDTSKEGSSTQPSAGDVSAEESGTRREDRWDGGQSPKRGLPGAGSRDPPRPEAMCPEWAQEGMVRCMCGSWPRGAFIVLK